MEYAVEPVGVDIIIPSAWTVVMNFSSQKQSRLERYGEEPRSITTSLRTCAETLPLSMIRTVVLIP